MSTGMFVIGVIALTISVVIMLTVFFAWRHVGWLHEYIGDWTIRWGKLIWWFTAALLGDLVFFVWSIIAHVPPWRVHFLLFTLVVFLLLWFVPFILAGLSLVFRSRVNLIRIVHLMGLTRLVFIMWLVYSTIVTLGLWPQPASSPEDNWNSLEKSKQDQICASKYSAVEGQLDMEPYSEMSKKNKALWAEQRNATLTELRTFIIKFCKPFPPSFDMDAGSPSDKDCGLDVILEVKGMHDSYGHTNVNGFTNSKWFVVKVVWTEARNAPEEVVEVDPEDSTIKKADHTYSSGGTHYPLVYVTDMVGLTSSDDTATPNLSRCDDEE